MINTIGYIVEFAGLCVVLMLSWSLIKQLIENKPREGLSNEIEKKQ